MIHFFYETTLKLQEKQLQEWVFYCVEQLNPAAEIQEINYIFCTDEYLLKINQDYLSHDYYTDIISFDHSINQTILSGDIYISIDRVKENAAKFKVPFKSELHRVLIHGVLHYLGYKDKTKEEVQIMRSKENYCLSLLVK